MTTSKEQDISGEKNEERARDLVLKQGPLNMCPKCKGKDITNILKYCNTCNNVFSDAECLEEDLRKAHKVIYDLLDQRKILHNNINKLEKSIKKAEMDIKISNDRKDIEIKSLKNNLGNARNSLQIANRENASLRRKTNDQDELQKALDEHTEELMAKEEALKVLENELKEKERSRKKRKRIKKASKPKKKRKVPRGPQAKTGLRNEIYEYIKTNPGRTVSNIEKKFRKGKYKKRSDAYFAATIKEMADSKKWKVTRVKKKGVFRYSAK